MLVLVEILMTNGLVLIYSVLFLVLMTSQVTFTHSRSFMRWWKRLLYTVCLLLSHSLTVIHWRYSLAAHTYTMTLHSFLAQGLSDS